MENDQLYVAHVADGDYVAKRNALVYSRNPDRSIFPRLIKRGETLSAADICEIEELGTTIIEAAR